MSFSPLENILFQSSQSGLFIQTLEGRMIDCNDAFLLLFGLSSKTEAQAYSLERFFHKASDYHSILDSLTMQSGLQGRIFKALNAEGQVMDISMNAHMLKQEGKETLIIGSLIDVSEKVRTQAIIAERDRKYKDFIDNSPEIIQSFNSEGSLIFCNPVWHQKLEYTPEEATRLNLVDIIADDYKQHCALLFQEVLNGKALKDVEVEFVSKHGKKYLLEGNIVPLVEQGKLIATHAFFRDVTEKKKAIVKIIEQEKLLQTVFNTVPICLYIKDSRGNYLHANEIMQRTLKSKVVDHSDSELFPTPCVLQLTDTDQAALDHPDQVVKFEMDVPSGEGSRYFLCGKKAILNADGKGYNLFGFSVDVTDFKNASLEIADKEKLLFSIINNTGGGFLLFTIDRANNLLHRKYSNALAEKLLDLKPSQNDFNSVFHFLDESFKTNLSVERLFADPQFSTSTDWRVHDQTTGAQHTYSLRFSAVLENDAKGQLFVSIIDITQEKLLIEQLEIKLGENQILIDEVHHRVKNNLAVVDGIIELKKSKVDDTVMREKLTEIQLRIKSISLVYGKLYQSGNVSLVNLREYVNELCNHYKRMFALSSYPAMDFDLQLETEKSLTISKSISFGLLLGELISNSCKYGLNNNRIHVGIHIHEEGEMLTMLYTDQGQGLPEEKKDLKRGGFGFRLMENYMKQLKGSSSFPTGNNFAFAMKFNV